jgi:DNA (cytosine-5)-methyltransferase 1
MTSTATIYDEVTRLGPPPPVHLTPRGIPIGRGRVYLTAEQLSRIDPFHFDGFAGGGGASEGYYLATGRHADVACNHDREALAMHRANHPFTEHFEQDIRRMQWRAAAGGRLVTSAHFSPDCKDFSKAKGGKPKSKRIRGLAWTIIHMVNELGAQAPLLITMENVEEFKEWCPLLPDGTRNKRLLGLFFRCFVGALHRRGYAVEWRELRACEASRAPTIRKRLYLIARRDSQPITWPEHLFGEGKPNRQGIAADILDFTLPGPSIFMTRRQARAYTRRTGIKIQRPLKRASLQRLAKGVGRYAVHTNTPFLVALTHQGNDGVESIEEAVKTVTGANRGEKGLAKVSLAAPFLTEHANAKHERNFRLDQGLRTQCAQVKGGHFALVVPVLAGVGGRAAQSRPRPGGDPLASVTAKADVVVAAVHLVRQFGTGIGSAADKPTGTVMSDGGGKTLLSSVFLAQNNTGVVGHRASKPLSTIMGRGTNQSVVAVGLSKYYGNEKDGHHVEAGLGTVTVKERFGLFEAQLEIPILTDELAKQARRVAKFLRCHGIKVDGEFAMCGEFVIVDIGMRMLTARELYRAQGFGEDYIIDFGYLKDGTRITLTKTAQVKMCGNSVCPPMAEALFRLNLPAHHLMKEAA